MQVPYWKSDKDQFELPRRPAGNSKQAGIKINMEPPMTPNSGGGIIGDTTFPVLIDFVGGRRKIVPNGNAEEDVAVDALIIGTDGKLRVLNSATPAMRPLAAGKDRQTRVEQVPRERVNELSGRTVFRRNGPAMPKKGGGLPGLPGVN